MTRSNGTKPPPTDTSIPPQVKVLGQYIDDLSFENIALRQQNMERVGSSEVDIHVNVDVRQNKKGNFEVAVTLSLTTKNKESKEVIFLLELKYLGVFAITHTSEQDLHPILMVECPRLLFPYIRRIASDLTHEAGYPPINLDPVDFLTLYRNSLTSKSES